MRFGDHGRVFPSGCTDSVRSFDSPCEGPGEGRGPVRRLRYADVVYRLVTMQNVRKADDTI
jgi:hypothetical protein